MQPFSEALLSQDERDRAVHYWEVCARPEVSGPEHASKTAENLQETADRLRARGWTGLTIGPELQAKLDQMKTAPCMGEAA